MTTLLGAQCGELEPVLRSQNANNFGGDYLFIGIGERDFEDYVFVKHQRLGNERPQATFAQVPHPTLKV